jgi:hypothetical protein
MMKSYSYLRLVMAVQIAVAIVTPASGATTVSTMNVSSTVAATCTIAPRILPGARAAAGVAGSVCLPTSTASTITAPQPKVVLAPDITTGITTMTVEF